MGLIIAAVLLGILLPLAHSQVISPVQLPQIPPGTSFQIQIDGISLDTSYNARVYEVDLYDTTVAQISTLKLQGKIVICYFSAGSFENWRPDISAFPSSVIGKAMAGWAGEYWLDIRQLQILGPIMKNRMVLGVQKGCDGFDPDNVDEYTYTQKETNWPLNVTHQLAYNRLLADTAHSLGKLVALKNCQDLATTLLPWYDFAVVEQCAQYNECALSSPFINAGKAVFDIEYSTSTTTMCSRTTPLNIDAQKKALALSAPRTYCRTYTDAPKPVSTTTTVPTTTVVPTTSATPTTTSTGTTSTQSTTTSETTTSETTGTTSETSTASSTTSATETTTETITTETTATTEISTTTSSTETTTTTDTTSSATQTPTVTSTETQTRSTTTAPQTTKTQTSTKPGTTTKSATTTKSRTSTKTTTTKTRTTTITLRPAGSSCTAGSQCASKSCVRKVCQ